jgi:hypothetical protein
VKAGERMIASIAFWFSKWFVTLLALGCFVNMCKRGWRQAETRSLQTNADGPLGGDVFAVAAFSGLALMLWLT